MAIFHGHDPARISCRLFRRSDREHNGFALSRTPSGKLFDNVSIC